MASNDGKLLKFSFNTPDIIWRTGNIGLTGSNIGPSSTRFGIVIAKMLYFDIEEQHIGIIYWYKGEKLISQKW